MASDAPKGGSSEEPGDSRDHPSGNGEDEGTGVWDAASAWEDDEAAPEQLWAPPASDIDIEADEWTEAGWVAGGNGYDPDDVPYYGEGNAGTPAEGYGAPDDYGLSDDYELSDDYGPSDATYGPPGGYVSPEPYAPAGSYAPADAYVPAGGYVPAYGPEEPHGPGTGPRHGGGQGGGGDNGGGARPGGGRRRRRGPWPELVIITAVAVIAAAAILAVTTDKHDRPQATGTSVTQTPATAQTTLPVTSTSTTTSTPQTSASSLPPGYDIAYSIPAKPQWESSLVTSWLSAERVNGISAADVEGEVPSTVQFAYTPATGTYWALTVFQPSPTLQAEASTAAGQAALAYFKGTDYAFSWQDGKTWTLLGDVPTGDCPGVWVPTPVLAAWSLCDLHPPRTPPGGTGT